MSCGGEVEKKTKFLEIVSAKYGGDIKKLCNASDCENFTIKLEIFIGNFSIRVSSLQNRANISKWNGIILYCSTSKKISLPTFKT